jgi:hypothetical protein
MPAPSRLTRALAVLASTFLALAMACAFGWWRAAHTERRDLEALGPEERQALLDEMIDSSPGAFVPAYFEPAIGYTLRRGRKLTAWSDTFRPNDIGYRTVSLAKPKPAGTYRVAFIGDSWTFGMGVSEAASFPRQVEELARQLGAGNGRRVQAVNLGLPGYNTANEIAALDFFWERVRPDAVVLCPTSNDADSTANVLPNGSLTRQGVERDAFGHDHSLVFRPRIVDSYEFRSRWRANFQAIRALEERLRARGVPLVLYFAATWDEPFAHALVQEAGLAAPYVITPRALASPRWRNAKWGHGTAEANRLYGFMVYKALAGALGWPAAPPPSRPGDRLADVPVWRRDPQKDWTGPADRVLAEATEKIPERYAPAPGAEERCSGPMDCATGIAGKATTILVRRRPGATRLAVTLRRLPDAPSLLPLAVRVSIPSPSGETAAETTLTADGPEERRVDLPLPSDVRPGAALDVTIHAARTIAAPGPPAPRALIVAAIEQTGPP